MAGNGPPPKDPARRRRRNADPMGRTTLEADGRVRGPKLPPDGAPLRMEWHPQTVKWWENWRRSPMAQQFLPTDWDFLLDTAIMHHIMWITGKPDGAAEIRLRVAKFGATVEDRARLRLDIQLPEPKSSKAKQQQGLAEVTDLDSRRQRLTG
jgi:hypothetical protein